MGNWTSMPGRDERRRLGRKGHYSRYTGGSLVGRGSFSRSAARRCRRPEARCDLPRGDASFLLFTDFQWAALLVKPRSTIRSPQRRVCLGQLVGRPRHHLNPKARQNAVPRSTPTPATHRSRPTSLGSGWHASSTNMYSPLSLSVPPT